MKWAVLAALLLAGCAESSKIVMPDGSQAFTVTCLPRATSTADCLKEAGQVCPMGYDTVKSENEGRVMVIRCHAARASNP